MELMNQCHFLYGSTIHTHDFALGSAYSAYDSVWTKQLWHFFFNHALFGDFSCLFEELSELVVSLNSSISSHDKLFSPPSNSLCVGGRSMMMSLLAALEQASCVELACYQTVLFIFGTQRWRTSWSIIDLFHYSILTTSPGDRGVFSSPQRVSPDPPVSMFGWTNVRASTAAWDFPSGHEWDSLS